MSYGATSNEADFERVSDRKRVFRASSANVAFPLVLLLVKF